MYVLIISDSVKGANTAFVCVFACMCVCMCVWTKENQFCFCKDKEILTTNAVTNTHFLTWLLYTQTTNLVIFILDSARPIPFFSLLIVITYPRLCVFSVYKHIANSHTLSAILFQKQLGFSPLKGLCS